MSTVTAPAVTPPRAETGWGALLVLLTGTFVTLLDFFIVNVAIPSIQVDLRAGPSAVQWVVAGFGLALAAGLITGGRLGDLYGRRRLYASGLGLFTLASAACGLAPSAAVLVGGRVLQGAAAALLMPQVLAIINTVYTGARRVRAFSAYGVAVGLGAVFGQLVGGLLIRADLAGLGWRSIFLINVPVGLAAMAASRRLVPESRSATGAGLDLVGTVLVTVGLVAIVYPLVAAAPAGWCLAALPPLAAFAWHQRRLAARGGAPLVHPHLFAARSYTVGVLVSLAFQLTMASFFLVLAVYLQDGRGLSALASGLLFAPLGLGYLVTSVLSGRIAARLGRQTLTVGTLVVAAGYGLLALAAQEPTGWLVPGLTVAGAGMGFVVAPLPSIVLAGVAARHAAAASGVLSTAQQAGNAVGVALIGSVFYHALRTGPFPHAFALSLGVLVALSVAVAVLVQWLPRRGA
ncbi:MFS transporter [Micromonospora sp. NPDC049836]|uniref:MFS transporter n=1 Tax=Micromonospora sp. NPDC049836 TaxID=3364274 RepID=UPI0037A26E11